MEGGRRLPPSLEDSNRAKALTVRERISEDVSRPQRTGPQVYHLRSLHRYSVHLSDYVAEAKRGDLIADSLFDQQLQRELEDSGALNWTWCKRGRGLHALKNAGQSNGLLDAVSVCMWGVSDSDMVLRRALYNTMAQSSPAHLGVASHEELSPTRQRITSEDWEAALKLASPKARAADAADWPYQRVHLFVLANVIRRPIVVVGGSTEDTEAAVGVASGPGPRGIYLPRLWESADCHPYPVVLGGSSPWRCFVPLVTAGSAQDDDGGVTLPLVWGPPGALRELPLHFLPDLDKGTRLSCLRAYLRLQNLPLANHTAYAARLRGHNLPEPFSLVQDYFQLANHTCRQDTQEGRAERGRDKQNGGLPLPTCPSSSSSSSPASSTAFSITTDKCATEHCRYFCSKFTWPLCHSCHGNRPQHQQRLQVRNCPPEGEGRGFSKSEGSSCRDKPPMLQPASGRSSSSPSCHGPSSAGATQGRPSDLECSPGVGGANESDFLCGRCLSCKRETRTFNGLCFRCLQSQTDPPATPAPDPACPAQTGRASPGREGSPGARRCLTPECIYFGSVQNGGYCTVCYCVYKCPLDKFQHAGKKRLSLRSADLSPLQDQTSTHSVPQAPPPSPSSSPSSSSSSSPSSSPLPLWLSSTLRNLPRCSDRGCDMLGNPAFLGLCERCFLASHKGAIKSQAPQTSVSQGSDRASRMCHRPLSKPDPPSVWTEKATAAHAESRKSGSGTPGKSQASAKPDRPRPCLGSGCTNYGNSRCRGLCNSCYKSHV